ncbi:MAG: ATP-binding protein [Acidobacteriota bacterium]|nr:ATP-binding protein [Acidobacteriota bacterium]
MPPAPLDAKERKEIDRLKGTFLANLNHEIRTPLSGILGMTDLLLETRLDEEQRDYVSTARLCAENLFHLLNATLEYSALTAGHLQLDETEFSLAELAKSVVAQQIEKVQAKGIGLTFTIGRKLPTTVTGDAARLQQTINHLLDNAIKFTHHGSVELSFWGEGDTLKIAVRDTGIGISPERKSRIFESFHQVDSGLSRNYPGLGLGLALVQKLTALMGGAIEAESELEKGSTFTVSLPLRPAAEPAPFLEHPSGEGPAILAVEDNPVGLTVLKHSLKGRPVQVDTASDGADAIRAASERHYELILMDLQMPKIDGLEATDAIRRLPGYQDVPILALTANYSDEIRQQCQQHGMQGFLSKPVSKVALWAEVSRWLNLTQ